VILARLRFEVFSEDLVAEGGHEQLNPMLVQGATVHCPLFTDH
jgi:hypothetical protein